MVLYAARRAWWVSKPAKQSQTTPGQNFKNEHSQPSDERPQSRRDLQFKLKLLVKTTKNASVHHVVAPTPSPVTSVRKPIHLHDVTTKAATVDFVLALGQVLVIKTQTQAP